MKVAPAAPRTYISVSTGRDVMPPLDPQPMALNSSVAMLAASRDVFILRVSGRIIHWLQGAFGQLFCRSALRVGCVMDRVRFHDLVAQALDEIPEPFRSRLENVEVVVE